MAIKKEDMVSLLSEYKKRNKIPFIIEVLGTPNAGKTSALQTFEKVLRRSGIKHKICYEPASRCKIKEKLSASFNIWTFSETLKTLLEIQNSNYDLVVFERGLVDTICWLNLYYKEKLITKDEYTDITNYILLDRFIKNIDCCYIMHCSVETSIKREGLDGLLDVYGTVINENTLTKYNEALLTVEENYGKRFHKVITLDTSELPQIEINRQFTKDIIEYMKEL